VNTFEPVQITSKNSDYASMKLSNCVGVYPCRKINNRRNKWIYVCWAA